ncbi:hypothetical protein VPHF86_0212 [Vibrio phage F86]
MDVEIIDDSDIIEMKSRILVIAQELIKDRDSLAKINFYTCHEFEWAAHLRMDRLRKPADDLVHELGRGFIDAVLAGDIDLGFVLEQGAIDLLSNKNCTRSFVHVMKRGGHDFVDIRIRWVQYVIDTLIAEVN